MAHGRASAMRMSKMFEPKTVETAVVPRPFFATYMATRQFGNDVPDAASNNEREIVGTPRTHALVSSHATIRYAMQTQVPPAIGANKRGRCARRSFGIWKA